MNCLRVAFVVVIVLLKCLGSGQVIMWTKVLGSSQANEAVSIVGASPDGSLYGNYPQMTAKFSPTGVLEWSYKHDVTYTYDDISGDAITDVSVGVMDSVSVLNDGSPYVQVSNFYWGAYEEIPLFAHQVHELSQASGTPIRMLVAGNAPWSGQVATCHDEARDKIYIHPAGSTQEDPIAHQVYRITPSAFSLFFQGSNQAQTDIRADGLSVDALGNVGIGVTWGAIVLGDNGGYIKKVSPTGTQLLSLDVTQTQYFLLGLAPDSSIYATVDEGSDRKLVHLDASGTETDRWIIGSHHGIRILGDSTILTVHATATPGISTLKRWSQSGQLLWQASTSVRALDTDGANRLITCGQRDTAANGTDALVQCFDVVSGQLLWESTYDGPDHGDDSFGAVDARGGYIALGGFARRNGSQDALYQMIGQSRFDIEPATVQGGTAALATLYLEEAARPPGYTFAVTSSAPCAVPPTSVSMAGGTNLTQFLVMTAPVATDTTATITMRRGTTTFSDTLRVLPAPLSSLSIAPGTVSGGSSATGTVTLSSSAPSGGTTVTIHEGSPYADVPSNVYVIQGVKTGSFSVSTIPVSTNRTVTVYASLGAVSRTATLTIMRPTLISLTSSSSIAGGNPLPLTVGLSSPAPTGGLNVVLSDNSPAAVTPSATIVPTSSTVGNVSISTSPVTASTSVTFTATLFGVSKTKTVTLTPAMLTTYSLHPSTVFGGFATVGTVVLNAPAPSGGLVVTLTSGNLALVRMPPSVTIPGGSMTTSFMVVSMPVTVEKTVATYATMAGRTLRMDLRILP